MQDRLVRVIALMNRRYQLTAWLYEFCIVKICQVEYCQPAETRGKGNRNPACFVSRFRIFECFCFSKGCWELDLSRPEERKVRQMTAE